MMEFEIVAAIVAEHFDMDKKNITESTNILEDLNADELEAAELIVEIESATDIKFPDEALDDMRTVGDIANYLAEHAEEPEAE